MRTKGSVFVWGNDRETSRLSEVQQPPHLLPTTFCCLFYKVLGIVDTVGELFKVQTVQHCFLAENYSVTVSCTLAQQLPLTAMSQVRWQTPVIPTLESPRPAWTMWEGLKEKKKKSLKSHQVFLLFMFVIAVSWDYWCVLPVIICFFIWDRVSLCVSLVALELTV